MAQQKNLEVSAERNEIADRIQAFGLENLNKWDDLTVQIDEEDYKVRYTTNESGSLLMVVKYFCKDLTAEQLEPLIKRPTDVIMT